MAGTPQHVTLVASTVATVTFDADFDMVEVTNVDGTAAVYFTVDGSAPTVGATGTEVLTAGIGAFVQSPAASSTHANSVVRLISTGTPKVSVKAW